MVAFFHRSDAGAGLDDDARAFVAQNGRKQAFRVGARQREFIGMTDAGCPDFDHDFAGARAVELDGRDFERLARRKGNGGANIHQIVPRSLPELDQLCSGGMTIWV